MRSKLKQNAIPAAFLAVVVIIASACWPLLIAVIEAKKVPAKPTVDPNRVTVVPPPEVVGFYLHAPTGWWLECSSDGSGRIDFGDGSFPGGDFKAGTIDFADAVRQLHAAKSDDDNPWHHFRVSFRRSWPWEIEGFSINDSSTIALTLFDKAYEATKEFRTEQFDKLWKKRPPGWYDKFTIESPQTPHSWYLRCERDGSGWVCYSANIGTKFREGTIDFSVTAKQLLKVMEKDGKPWNGFGIMVYVGGVRRSGYSTDSKFILALFEKAARKEVSEERNEYFDKFWKEEPPSFSHR